MYKRQINKVPKSVARLSKEISVPIRILFRNSRLLIRELEIEVNKNFGAEDFVPGICGAVGANMKIEKKALQIINQFQERINVSGKNPQGIAVAAIYLVSEKKYKENPLKYAKITQKELTTIAGITEPTLRLRVKEILSLINLKS